MNFDDLLTKLNLTQEQGLILLEFFVKFSQFEYKLVSKKFRKINSKHNFTSVEVNWDLFVNYCLEKHKNKTNDLIARSKDFLKNQPPQKLSIDDFDNLIWKRNHDEILYMQNNGPAPVNEFHFLTVLVRRVRNNLFHGAKNMDLKDATILRLKEVIPILDQLDTLLSEIQPN